MPAPPTLPPIVDKPLSVLLLADANAEHAATVVPQWLAYLDAFKRPWELLLVVDGPESATSSLTISHARFRIHHLGTPQGEGVALRVGLDLAQLPLLFYALCHPDYPPSCLETFLDRKVPDMDNKPRKEMDLVHLMSGFRAGVRVPGVLRMLGGLWRWFWIIVFAYSPMPLLGWLGLQRQLGWLAARLVFGLRQRDLACPCRLLRREILPRIRIQSQGSFAHVELLAKANFLGFLMGEELPLDVRPGPYRGDAGQIWRDARKVVNNPDFGPVELPPSQPSPVGQGASEHVMTGGTLIQNQPR